MSGCKDHPDADTYASMQPGVYMCGYCGKVVQPPLAYHEGPEDCANAQQEGGSHYRDMKVQPWEAMDAWMTPEQFKGFLLGTAIAYLGRFNANTPGKGGVLDIKKARHTLQRLIEACEKAP